MKRFYSHGKLLLSAEYLVLDGAIGLAIPTKLGQEMTVEANENERLEWTSYDREDRIWFRASFDLENFDYIVFDGEEETAETLKKIFEASREMKPSFWEEAEGAIVRTFLEFDRSWGLGSSSTLINNIAQWVNTDPFQLLFKSMGGSGYDIACANASGPLFYQVLDQKPKAWLVEFDPSFKDELYFVHLNRKQSSAESIALYAGMKQLEPKHFELSNKLSREMFQSQSSKNFGELMRAHELLMASVLNQKPIKEELFTDFQGEIKSLGAWGGDFVLVCGSGGVRSYFEDKGYPTVISYAEMVL